jgi:hypothetical protein
MYPKVLILHMPPHWLPETKTIALEMNADGEDFLALMPERSCAVASKPPRTSAARRRCWFSRHSARILKRISARSWSDMAALQADESPAHAFSTWPPLLRRGACPPQR